jgi:hypothetical protein
MPNIAEMPPGREVYPGLPPPGELCENPVSGETEFSWGRMAKYITGLVHHHLLLTAGQL